jgi:hypothetical protein
MTPAPISNVSRSGAAMARAQTKFRSPAEVIAASQRPFYVGPHPHLRATIVNGRAVLDAASGKALHHADPAIEAEMHAWFDDFRRQIAIDGLIDIYFAFTAKRPRPRASHPDAADRIETFFQDVAAFIDDHSETLVAGLDDGAEVTLRATPGRLTGGIRCFFVTPQRSVRFDAGALDTRALARSFTKLYRADPHWWNGIAYLEIEVRLQPMSAHRRLAHRRAIEALERTTPPPLGRRLGVLLSRLIGGSR